MPFSWPAVLEIGHEEIVIESSANDSIFQSRKLPDIFEDLFKSAEYIWIWLRSPADGT